MGQQFSGQHSGLFGINLPQPAGLEQILAWPRGLLVESPFLIFVVFGFIRWWRSAARPSAELLVCLAISIIYPLLIASYYLPMGGQNLPGPRLLVPMLPFVCLALAWALDVKNILVRGAFAVLLALGVLLSYLYVVLGVYEYHTILTYPIANLYLPVLQNGSVPIQMGRIPTPYNLATLYFNMAQPGSLYIVLVPLAAWTMYLAVSLVLWRGRPEAEERKPMDAQLSREKLRRLNSRARHAHRRTASALWTPSAPPYPPRHRVRARGLAAPLPVALSM